MKTTDEKIIRINFGGKRLTLTNEKAKKFIKLGLKAEKYDSVLKDLEFLAKREKLSLDEFVKAIKSQKDELLSSSILEKVNGDEELAQKLIDYENSLAESDPQEKSDELAEVLEHFSEYKSYDDIPDEAIILSETKNISLFDALLRYLFFQSKLIEKEHQNREKNKQGAVGSLKTNEADYGLSYISAMMKAINK